MTRLSRYGEDDSCARWTNDGMQAMQDGDERAAAELFATGARRHSSDSSMWTNTAVAQASLLAGGQVTLDEKLELYCEARASALLALRAGSDGAVELLQSIESQLAGVAQQAHGAESNTEAGPLCPYDNVLPGLSRVANIRSAAGDNLEQYLQAVHTGCEEKSLVVELTGHRKKDVVGSTAGDISAGNLLAISSLLDSCGVVAVVGIHDPATIDRAREAQLEHFSRINLTQLKQPGAHKTANSRRSSEFHDMAVRGDPRRIEATLPLDPTFSEINAAPAVLSIVEYVMQDRDLEIDTHSYVHSEPGSPQQHWHRDVDFLHGEVAIAATTGSRNSAHHTPPYGVVAVVPLVDLETNNGATEFILGSHVHPAVLGHGLDLWEGMPRLNLTKLLVPRGSMLLFDLRTTHRGGPNESELPRSVLYTSYVREWFRDAVNFRPPQSGWLDGLRSERLQKLFSRVDGRDYTLKLEKLLAQKGIDVKTELSQQRDGESQ
eukprot:COSAG02_NODE_2416_length_8909_cov_10.038252_8_plen_491_part_00